MIRYRDVKCRVMYTSEPASVIASRRVVPRWISSRGGSAIFELRPCGHEPAFCITAFLTTFYAQRSRLRSLYFCCSAATCHLIECSPHKLCSRTVLAATSLSDSASSQSGTVSRSDGAHVSPVMRPSEIFSNQQGGQHWVCASVAGS
jgi:hypothetical protein